MILKSYLVEQNVDILKKYSLTLMYGENDGIKDDIKEVLESKSKDAEIFNLFQDEIQKDEETLLQKITDDSLFNEKKLIFIYDVTDKIFSTIEHIVENTKKNIKIYLLSSQLDKKSKLRSLFEKNINLAIIPCYQDSDRTLGVYINDKLKSYKGLTPECLRLIIENSHLNRQIIKSEIIKIKAYFKDKKINKADLESILNVKISNDFDQIRDAALAGNKLKINKLMGEIDFMTDDNYYYLNSLSYRITKLIEVKNIDDDIKNCDLILDSLKPKIFWKDKPAFIEQLKKWDLEKLKKASNVIGKTEALMKKETNLRKDLLVKNLLINICNQSFIF